MLDKPRINAVFTRATTENIGAGSARMTPQAFVAPDFGRLSPARASGLRRPALRPIDLERRARFARFDA